MPLCVAQSLEEPNESLTLIPMSFSQQLWEEG